MNKQLCIIVTEKNAPTINTIKKMAELQPKKRQFTNTLMEILELGLHFYKGGYRIIDGQLIKIQKENI